MTDLVLGSLGAVVLGSIGAVATAVGVEFVLYKLGHKNTLFHESWKTFLK